MGTRNATDRPGLVNKQSEKVLCHCRDEDDACTGHPKFSPLFHVALEYAAHGETDGHLAFSEIVRVTKHAQPSGRIRLALIAA
jgi:hypothetical protein